MKRYMIFIFVVVCFSICYTVPLDADDSRAVYETEIKTGIDNVGNALITDDEPIPHNRNWLDEKTLRIETEFQGMEVRVDFKIKGNGDFYQEHSRIASSGNRILTFRTKYSRIK
jgi:hypothetical protein